MDAGKDGCRIRRMHERRDAVKTGGIQERMDRRYTEWERFGTGGIKDSWEAGQVGCRTEGFRTGWMQERGIHERRNAGKE